jgi:uracil-DNA glycosylase
MLYNYYYITKRIHPGWLPFFEENKEHLINIIEKLNELKKQDKIYPNKKDIFRALYYHPPEDIKLVIIGQDPYINEENNTPQAMGLCFSVPRKHKKIPPSLQNIRKEIKNCYLNQGVNYIIPKHGLLKKWARKEKMLLLNSSLTVCKGKSNSHAYLWTDFTDKLIEWFSNKNKTSCFLLMGNYAKSKEKYISNHKIFNTAHPSPLSAHNGFFNSNVFRLINDYLEEQNIDTINW